MQNLKVAHLYNTVETVDDFRSPLHKGKMFELLTAAALKCKSCLSRLLSPQLFEAPVFDGKLTGPTDRPTFGFCLSRLRMFSEGGGAGSGQGDLVPRCSLSSVVSPAEGMFSDRIGRSSCSAASGDAAGRGKCGFK